VFMNLKSYDGKKPVRLEKIDELFLVKLNKLVKDCTRNFEEYEYSKIKMDVEKFFWNFFCDNYLEIIKKRIYNGKGDKKKSAQYTLHSSLLVILKLIAPIMPLITEEIYQKYFRKTEKDKSIHLTKWPKAEGREQKTDELDLFIEILGKIRQEKSNNKKSMNAEVILNLEKDKVKKLAEMVQDLKDVANAREIKEGKFKVEFV